MLSPEVTTIIKGILQFTKEDELIEWVKANMNIEANGWSEAQFYLVLSEYARHRGLIVYQRMGKRNPKNLLKLKKSTQDIIFKHLNYLVAVSVVIHRAENHWFRPIN